jgi:hypothetical protein
MSNEKKIIKLRHEVHGEAGIMRAYEIPFEYLDRIFQSPQEKRWKKELAKMRSELYSQAEIMCKYKLSFEDLENILKSPEFPQQKIIPMEKTKYPRTTWMYPKKEVEDFFKVYKNCIFFDTLPVRGSNEK